MRYAIFSDLHANFQAWEAVRDDISRVGVDILICLGDVVGYGPRPQEVLESVYELTQNFVLGNHDAVIGGRLDPEIFNDHAREIIEWTRDHLNDDARQFFSEVPFTIEGADFLAVHAEAAQPGRFCYIVEPEDARESFAATAEQIIFVGHTHHPGRFELNGGKIEKFGSEDFRIEKGRRYVVNTGSVGEPRTPDIHASYCIYDSFQKRITFRKLPFDIEGYKRDLEAVGLPIRPYFLDVYESGGGQVVHQPAELAMKRTPMIPAAAATGGRAHNTVRTNSDPRIERAFGSAAEAYRAQKTEPKTGKSVALWITVSLVLVGVLAVGIFALINKGGEDGDLANQEPNGGVQAPQVVMSGTPGEITPIPDDISWENLVVSGYRNLAGEATVSSDGFSRDKESKGDAAAIDGDPETYLKKVDGKTSYLLAVKFAKPTSFSALSLTGKAQNENAAEDFEVIADGKKIRSVVGATYEDNQLLVPLPKTTASILVIKVSKSYGGAPAIRELGVYDWGNKDVPDRSVAGTSPATGTDTAVAADTGTGVPAAPVPPTPPAEDPKGENVDGDGDLAPHQMTNGTSEQTFFLPVASEGEARWKYTTQAPPQNWSSKEFVPDETWLIGLAGFGQGAIKGDAPRTRWDTADIWMRTRFEIPEDKLNRSGVWYLLLRHDDACEVYLNGNKIYESETHIPLYTRVSLSDEIKLMVAPGINVLAVHCKQETGDQIVDVGMAQVRSSSKIAAEINQVKQVASAPPNPGRKLAGYVNHAVGSKISRPDSHEIFSPKHGAENIADENLGSAWRGKPGGKTYAIKFDFEKPVEVSTFTIAGEKGRVPKVVVLEFDGVRANISSTGQSMEVTFSPVITTASATMTVLEWEGDAPGIQEIGFYNVAETGKKKPASVAPPTPHSVRLSRGEGGYEGVADTRISYRKIPGKNQPVRGANFGGQNELIVGGQGGTISRTLMRFDLTGKFPPDSKFGPAKLKLFLAGGNDQQKVDLYLINPQNSSWIEGLGKSADDDARAAAGATWDSPDSSKRGGWFGNGGLGEPGLRGGYLSRGKDKGKPVCSGAVDLKQNLLEFTVPASVIQLWSDTPNLNAGILLRLPEEDAEAEVEVKLFSSEAAEVGKRPALDVKIAE